MADEVVNLLWQETAGHPALVTDIMKAAVDLGGDVAGNIMSVIDADFARGLEAKYFEVWWRNLREPGQHLYRQLLAHAKPLASHRVSSMLSKPAGAWVRVLETTGVAREMGGELLPRGELFARWAKREQFFEVEADVRLADHLEPLSASMSIFERELSVAMPRWARGVIEYAGLGLLLKSDSKPQGNNRLLPEAHFQLFLLLALQQHGWQVEAEGWSVAGRSDLKIRHDEHRSCIELKIWNRINYQCATEQVISYALPSDEFASVVMIDRQAKSLFERYAQLLADKGHEVIAQSRTDPGTAPQFVTKHTRSAGPALRVHHYLVQLPGDTSG